MGIKHVALKIALTSFFLTVNLSASQVHAGTIKSISIKEIGKSSTEEDKDICKLFKPTLAQLRRYFNKALPVPDRVITTVRYSPCYAKGTLEFSDGYEANWVVSSGGGGGLDWLIGGRVYLLYKGNAWIDPYKGMYDDELDNDGNSK